MFLPPKIDLPNSNPALILEAYIATLVCSNDTHGPGSLGFLVFFAWCPSAVAIALELLRRAQAHRCAVCAVADGGPSVAHYDDCAVLAVVASRVSRWPQRSRWWVQWGSEWVEWPPVLRLPTVSAADSVRPSAAPTPSIESIFRRETSLLIARLLLSRPYGPVSLIKTISYEHLLNIRKGQFEVQFYDWLSSSVVMGDGREALQQSSKSGPRSCAPALPRDLLNERNERPRVDGLRHFHRAVRSADGSSSFGTNARQLFILLVCGEVQCCA